LTLQFSDPASSDQLTDNLESILLAIRLYELPEDVPSSVELRWRPDSSGDVHEVILHDGSDSFGDLAFERGA
jgi:hypothetical protein